MVGLTAIALVCSLYSRSDAATVATTSESGVVTTRAIEVLGQTDSSGRYYSQLLADVLASHWSPPKVQPYTKIEAKATMDVLRSGRIKNVRMASASESEDFDLSVINAIREASPFPPAPPLYKGDEVPLTIRFSLEAMSQIDQDRRLRELKETEAKRAAEEREQQRRKAAKLAAEERSKEIVQQKEIEKNIRVYLPGKTFECIGGKLDPVCVGGKRETSSLLSHRITYQEFGKSTFIFGHYWAGLACRIYVADFEVRAIACE